MGVNNNKLITHELDDYLAHYGVLGMKWGVRKDGKPQGFQYGKKGRKKAKKTKAVSEDKNISNKLSRRDPDTLSNQELQTLNRRLELEANYNRLMANEKTTLKVGYDHVDKTFKATLGATKTALDVVKVIDRLSKLSETPTYELGKKLLEKVKR